LLALEIKLEEKTKWIWWQRPSRRKSSKHFWTSSRFSKSKMWTSS